MNDSDTITDDSVKQNQRKNTRKLKAYKKSNELSRWSINSCVRIEASISHRSGYTMTTWLISLRNYAYWSVMNTILAIMMLLSKIIFSTSDRLLSPSFLEPSDVIAQSRSLSHKNTKIRKHTIRTAQNIQNFKNLPNIRKVMVI